MLHEMNLKIENIKDKIDTRIEFIIAKLCKHRDDFRIKLEKLQANFKL